MKWIYLTLFYSALMLSSFPAVAHTIKTNHVDVNLWSGPGRETTDRIGKIQRFEEVNVLSTRTLSDGQKWYKVQLRRSPGWRTHSQIGWVDAQFFDSIEKPVADDQPTEADAAATCKSCLAARQRSETAHSNTSDLTDVASQPGKSSKGFIWPVTGTITSGFGMRRHPITGIVKLHNGTDIGGNNGKPVGAAKSGTIIQSVSGCSTGNKSCNGGAGNMIVIDHGDGTQTKYMHLNPACPLARRGSRVDQGEKIACVGSTGASTGPHLHFSVIVNGNYINPLTVLPGRG